MRKFFIVVLAALLCGCAHWDAGYQVAQDPVRLQHWNLINQIILKYREETGELPLQKLSQEQGRPFMVLIGRSEREEDIYSNHELYQKGALLIYSTEFEEIISEGFGQKVILPRDPQYVASYGPNVYLYFIDSETYCVGVNLYDPSEYSEPYKWQRGTFHAHVGCFTPSGT